MDKVIGVKEFPYSKQNPGWEISEPEYFNDFVDKVYVSNIKDERLMTDLLNLPSVRKNSGLAGDIKQEMSPILNQEMDLAIRKELSWHLCNLLNLNVVDVKLANNGDQINFWINYQKPGEYNPIHFHSGIFSFVYYAQLPEEIRNEHKKQNGNKNSRGLIEFINERNRLSEILNPKQGQIFIFYANYMHQVYPFYSDNTRISVAGNIHDYKIEGQNETLQIGQSQRSYS